MEWKYSYEVQIPQRYRCKYCSSAAWCSGLRSASFSCQSLSRSIYVICLSPLSVSQNVKEKQLLKCSTLSLSCLSILLWHERLLFIFVHACELQVKTHTECELLKVFGESIKGSMRRWLVACLSTALRHSMRNRAHVTNITWCHELLLYGLIKWPWNTTKGRGKTL